MGTKLVLPLMMFGKVGNYWHEEGQPIRKKVKVGTTVWKSGAKKGKERPLYDWIVAIHKAKVPIGEELITRGKNKGKFRVKFETREMALPSTGFFPSANRIYITNPRGARILSDAAANKLIEWQNAAIEWAKNNDWKMRMAGTKVIADMTFYLPDDSIRDTHNTKKLLLDSLEGVIHENDMWILDRTIDFQYDKKNPRIEIQFREFFEG
jgi:Holliday junction resolvase RusA-like endonuclease